MGVDRRRVQGGTRGRFTALLGTLAALAWGVPAHLPGQVPDEVAQASFLRWGCAGCHGAPWAGIPSAGAPSFEGLGEGHAPGWLVGYLLGDSLRNGSPHPIPFGGPAPVADSLATWLLGGPAGSAGAPPEAVVPESPPPEGLPAGVAPPPAGVAPGDAVPGQPPADASPASPAPGPADPLAWTGALPPAEGWRAPAAAVAAVALVGVLLLLFRPAPVMGAGGWGLAALLLLVLPVLAFALGAGHHLDRSRTTAFCLSCHVMERWGESLTGAAGTGGALAALHFQDRLIPRDRACYTCHTQYTMYGDLQSKALGVRHLLVNALGGPPDTLRLYSPYENRECLHCHGGADAFEALPVHRGLEPGGEQEATSCLGCHGPAHGLEGVR